MRKTQMKLRQWLAILFISLLTFLAIAGWHSYSTVQAQTPTPTRANPQKVSSSVSLQDAGLTLQDLGFGVFGLIASTDFPPTGPNVAICNGGIVIGSEGVLVIDPFQNTELGNLMLATVQTLTDKPIKYVLNTHYHFDHSGGNPAAAALGIPVIGRGTIREFIANRNKSLDPNPKLPDVIINSTSDIWLGDRRVAIERVEGHSAGTDLIAYVPDAKVLFTGDMFFNKKIPAMMDANIRDWQGSLYRLITTYGEARVVPGHGDVTDKSGLQELQAYFSDLEKLALSWKAQNLTKEQVIAQYSQLPDAYKDYKFQALYAPNKLGITSNLEIAYDQITRSATIPLVP